MYFSAVYR